MLIIFIIFILILNIFILFDKYLKTIITKKIVLK